MDAKQQENLRQARKVGLDNVICNLYRMGAEQLVSVIDRYPIQPNQVTTLSLLLTICASFFASRGTYSGFVLCANTALLACFLDFVDGSLARRKNLASPFGSYLDNFFDDLGQIFLALGLALGLRKIGSSDIASLSPIVIYAGDMLIAFTMTRYRLEFIDPISNQKDLGNVFKESLLLQIGRTLLPPVYSRTLIFPLFAVLSLTAPFLNCFAFYTMVLALAFAVKVGIDIYSLPKPQKNSHSS